jgi:hypothetical protein
VDALGTLVPRALAALTLALGLAACGDDDDAPAETSETTAGTEDPTTTASDGPELPYDEMDAEMQGFASSYCEDASTWTPESTYTEISGAGLALRAGQAGPDLEPFGERIENSSGPEEDAQIAADMTEACSLIGWSAE